MADADPKNWRTRPDLRRHREMLRRWLPIAELAGLEMGPLDKPLVERGDGSIRYVDQYSVEELAQHVRNNPNRDEHALVELDYVLGERGLSEVVAERFDYVAASHVIEHVANPLGWLREVAGLLRAPGWLFLVVPDRRFTFDYHRPLTSLGQLVESDLENRTRPPVAAAFDQRYYHRKLSSHALWAGTEDPAAVPPSFEPEQALALARQAAQRPVDCHVSVFEADSLREHVEVSRRLGLQPFACKEIVATERPFLDFMLLLETPG